MPLRLQSLWWLDSIFLITIGNFFRRHYFHLYSKKVAQPQLVEYGYTAEGDLAEASVHMEAEPQSLHCPCGGGYSLLLPVIL